MRFHHPGPPPSLDDYRRRPPSPSRLTGGRGATGEAPRFSVVTVARNAAKTIGRTLRSVQAQSGVSLEHIVVDGGSTDGTLDILRQQGDAIAQWLSEPDQGIADAFNKGIALARGSIIGILNADDEYETGAVAASVAALDADPGAGFSFGDCLMVDPSGERLAMASLDFAAALAVRMPDTLRHPTVFVRQSVYEQFGLFRPEYRIAMDYDFLLRLHGAGVRPALVRQTVARMHGGGVSEMRMGASRREALRASVLNGGSPLAAAYELVANTADYYAWDILKRIGWPRVKKAMGRWA